MSIYQLIRRLWPLGPRSRRGRTLPRRSGGQSLCVEVLEDRCLLSTGLPFLVKDINPGAPGSNPQGPVAINGVTYFAADDGVNGAELWRSDGTEVGTVMVKDLTPGSAGSSPFNLTNVNGRLFFEANYVYFQGSELWTSDGTPEGTVRLKTRSFGNLIDVNGTLFFTADYGLWKSNGTVEGTVRVTDPNIVPLYTTPTGLTNVNGTVFFAANGGQGVELWKSDGTAKGTVLVKDINGGGTSETYTYRGHRYHYRIPNSSNPNNLINVNGTLYFTADNGNNGRELWKSDGTSGATKLVKDINPNGSSNPFALTNVNGTLYFSASDGTNGFELWKTDGTVKGTQLVKDIVPGSTSSVPNNLTNVNGTLFFTADEGASGRELWKSDGTAEGTLLVKDIRAGSASSGATGLTNVNGTLYFAANDGVTGMELWRSNGTAGGTALVADINPGSASSSPAGLTVAGGQFFFSADDGVHGRELWDPPAGGSGRYLFVDQFTESGRSPSGAIPGFSGSPYIANWVGGVRQVLGANETTGTFSSAFVPPSSGGFNNLFFIVFASRSENQSGFDHFVGDDSILLGADSSEWLAALMSPMGKRPSAPVKPSWLDLVGVHWGFAFKDADVAELV